MAGRARRVTGIRSCRPRNVIEMDLPEGKLEVVVSLLFTSQCPPSLSKGNTARAERSSGELVHTDAFVSIYFILFMFCLRHNR